MNSLFLGGIKKWIYTDTNGVVREMDKSKQIMGFVWERFSKVNHINCFSKASFLKSGPGSFDRHVVQSKSPEEMMNEKRFATLYLTSGGIRNIKIQEFKLLIYQIFHFSEESEGSLEMLNSIYAIQAFRDSNNPLKNYREVFKHFVQLKDGKYYSLVKNGIYLFFIL